MFSKALLLLAVCFQALRTGNSADYGEKIHGGWQIGKSVNVNIKTYLYEHPNCKIEFQDEKGDKGDCLLVSFDGSASRFVINTYINGKWQSEDNDRKIDIRKDNLIVDVIPEKEGFKIKFKGKEYFRKYDFPLKNIKQIKVVCPRESDGIQVKTSWHKECTCQSEL